jgi:hypothetical protein
MLCARDRCRAEDRSSKRKRGKPRPPPSTIQIPFEWTPRRGEPLTDEEQEYTKMTADVMHFRKVTLNFKYPFRTRKSQEKNANDDSCVKVWYDEPDGTRTPSFGWIDSIFVHEVRPGRTKCYFIKVEWATLLTEKSCTGMQQIEQDEESNFNKCASVSSIADVVPYNLAFFPQNIKSQEAHRCTTYAVLDPHERLGMWRD